MSQGNQFYLPPGLAVPVPLSTGVDATYWEGLRGHELRLQRCSDCDAWRWPAEVICSDCLSFDADWLAVEPAGHIYSWTRVHHPARPQLRDTVPYLVIVVELVDAGKNRVLGNLLGDPAQPFSLGDRVVGEFEDHDHEGYEFSILNWRRSANGG